MYLKTGCGSSGSVDYELRTKTRQICCKKRYFDVDTQNLRWNCVAFGKISGTYQCTDQRTTFEDGKGSGAPAESAGTWFISTAKIFELEIDKSSG